MMVMVGGGCREFESWEEMWAANAEIERAERLATLVDALADHCAALFALGIVPKVGGQS